MLYEVITYNFAITGNLEYIESVKDDLSHIISHYEDTDPSETT